MTRLTLWLLGPVVLWALRRAVHHMGSDNSRAALAKHAGNIGRAALELEAAIREADPKYQQQWIPDESFKVSWYGEGEDPGQL